jgi:hypothetical protein
VRRIARPYYFALIRDQNLDEPPDPILGILLLGFRGRREVEISPDQTALGPPGTQHRRANFAFEWQVDSDNWLCSYGNEKLGERCVFL